MNQDETGKQHGGEKETGVAKRKRGEKSRMIARDIARWPCMPCIWRPCAMPCAYRTGFGFSFGFGFGFGFGLVSVSVSVSFWL